MPPNMSAIDPERTLSLFALCSSLRAAAKPIPQPLRVINIFVAQSL
jgi:hypothetical protein